MSVKAWVSLSLPVPHQLCSAPAALSLNVILVCCDMVCLKKVVLLISPYSTDAHPVPYWPHQVFLPVYPGHSLLPLVRFPACPLVSVLSHDTGTGVSQRYSCLVVQQECIWHDLEIIWPCMIIMWYQMPAFSYDEGHVPQPVLCASERKNTSIASIRAIWPQGSVLLF